MPARPPRVHRTASLSHPPRTRFIRHAPALRTRAAHPRRAPAHPPRTHPSRTHLICRTLVHQPRIRPAASHAYLTRRAITRLAAHASSPVAHLPSPPRSRLSHGAVTLPRRTGRPHRALTFKPFPPRTHPPSALASPAAPSLILHLSLLAGTSATTQPGEAISTRFPDAARGLCSSNSIYVSSRSALVIVLVEEGWLTVTARGTTATARGLCAPSPPRPSPGRDAAWPLVAATAALLSVCPLGRARWAMGNNNK